MSQHLQTPLRMAPAGLTGYTPSCDIYDATGELICDLSSTDHAAVIVTACNSHEKLVEALNECKRYFSNRRGNHETQMVEIIGKALALALAQQGRTCT